MAHVKSLEDKRVITTLGYSFQFKAKETTWIPDPALAAVLKAGGIVECDEHGKLKFNDDTKEEAEVAAKEVAALKDIPALTTAQRNDPELRSAAIKAAIRYLLTQGNPADFRTDNTPKSRAISRTLGFDVGGTELLEAFDAVQSE